MKAVVLNSSRSNSKIGMRLSAALSAQLQSQGWDVEHIALCEKRIGNCAGDFFCWIRNPGLCNINDDNRKISEALVACDLIVYLTPITFGGYSSTLKRMVDHQIQNVSPFFAMVAGETHHRKRYQKNPDLLVIGWKDAPDAHAEAVFHHLVQRNAINFHAKTWISAVVYSSQSDEEMSKSAQNWLDQLQYGRSSNPIKLPDDCGSAIALRNDPTNRSVEIRKALLLVGSPKTRKSTSNSLGEYLFKGLSERSIQTETIYLHTVLRNPKKLQALLDAVEAADLVTLAFPIYVDTLPAPVIEALERIAEGRKNQPARSQLFTAIANCGFPEAHQCDTALANCEIFAQKAGFEWVGALALGAGHMVQGAPLAEAGGMTIRMRQSLDLAAEALAQGQDIPEEARDGLAKPIIPHWLYRLAGWWGWNQQAKSYGVKKLLKRQPYLAKAE